MFWRKTRAAIAGFHPLHQELIWQRGFSATQRPADWAALFASLAGHSTLVRRAKWRLPPRTVDLLVPLLQIISQDMAATGFLGVTTDLRGPDAPGKTGPSRELPARRPIRSIKESYIIDPWLRLRAELHDGSVLELAVTDRIRQRRIAKTSRSGKYKSKTKRKAVQLVRVSRTLPKGRRADRPVRVPPAWIRVRVRQDRRWSLTASAKIACDAPGYEQVQRILTVVAEPFRWNARPTSDERRAG